MIDRQRLLCYFCFPALLSYFRFNIDRTAIIRKAIPAQNSLLKRNQTTMATMAAGRKKKKVFTMNRRIIIPIAMRASETIQSKIAESS